MNLHAIRVIYAYELGRTWKTIFQSLAAPVLTTSLYFIVFGSAIGGRMQAIDGIGYGAFIIPGLLMLTILSESISNSSFAIFLPRFTGTVYELLSAPLGTAEVLIGYIGAAVTKSMMLAVIILITARFFVDYHIAHPWLALLFLILIATSFSLFGFILGLWADGFERLQIVPLMVITPLTFLGGTFYSIAMLPPFWQTASLFNPVVYLISGLRWAFYDIADVSFGASLGMTLVFMTLCVGIVSWIFHTGYRLRT